MYKKRGILLGLQYIYILVHGLYGALAVVTYVINIINILKFGNIAVAIGSSLF